MSGGRAEPATASPGRQPGLFLPACLVLLAAASAALGWSFYFRGEGGDYNLHHALEPHSGGNAYDTPEASRTLIFHRLLPVACACTAGVLACWTALGRALARREGLRPAAALRRAAPALYPLILLLLIPAHHFVGLPLTIGPVFLIIACAGAAAAVAGYLLKPAFGGRFARAISSVWGAWGLCAAYVAAFTTLSLLEYHALHTGFADTGSFAEGLYHGSRGEALRSNWQSTGTVFQRHPVLILVPLSHLYRLWPRHELLLVLQSVGLGLGAVAVYLLTQAVLADRPVAWCLAAAYVLAPTTAFVNLPSTYGFRPMSLLVPTLLWAMCFLERRQMLWYWLCAFLALYVKETAAPVLVMLALFVAVRHRWWWTAGGTLALAVGWFLLVTRVVQPMVLEGPYVFSEFLDHFGTSASEVAAHVLRHPFDTLDYVLGEPLKVFFVLHLLVPLLAAGVLSPAASLTWAASVMILLMSHYHGKYVILIGSQSPALAGLYFAAAHGLRNLAERRGPLLRRVLPRHLVGDRERVLRAAGLGILAAAALSHYFFFLRTMPWGRFVVRPRTRVVEELRRRVPRGASLCASYRLASHFTDQADLYVAPQNLLGARYVVLDLYDECAGLPAAVGYRDRVLRSGLYKPVLAREGFLLFQRGALADVRDAYRLDAEPECQYRVGAALGGFATLLGYDAETTRSGLALTLYWRCDAPTAEQLAVRLRFARDTGVGPLSWRHLPADGVVPTWAWRPGDLILDRVVVPGLALGQGKPIEDALLEPVEGN